MKEKNLIHKIKRLQKLDIISPEDSKVAIERICIRLDSDTKKKKREIEKKLKNSSKDLESLFLKYIPVTRYYF